MATVLFRVLPGFRNVPLCSKSNILAYQEALDSHLFYGLFNFTGFVLGSLVLSVRQQMDLMTFKAGMYSGGNFLGRWKNQMEVT